MSMTIRLENLVIQTRSTSITLVVFVAPLTSSTDGEIWTLVSEQKHFHYTSTCYIRSDIQMLYDTAL